MQPAPLTGTATRGVISYNHFTFDAARTPHGGSNVMPSSFSSTQDLDAARTPHGDKKGGVTQGSV